MCAGAYASPVLLMRSGIGPADHLQSHGIGVIADLRGVGENLADLHLFAWGPAPVPGGSQDEQRLGVNVGLLDPASRGRVRLASPSPDDAPSIDPGFLTEQEDVERFAAGVREARRLIDAGALAAHALGPEMAPGTELPDADLERLLPQVVRTYFHPAGTCRLGPDPGEGAVVDRLGRVYGVEGLVVADASRGRPSPRGPPSRLIPRQREEGPDQLPAAAGAATRLTTRVCANWRVPSGDPW